MAVVRGSGVSIRDIRGWLGALSRNTLRSLPGYGICWCSGPFWVYVARTKVTYLRQTSTSVRPSARNPAQRGSQRVARKEAMVFHGRIAGKWCVHSRCSRLARRFPPEYASLLAGLQPPGIADVSSAKSASGSSSKKRTRRRRSRELRFQSRISHNARRAHKFTFDQLPECFRASGVPMSDSSTSAARRLTPSLHFEIKRLDDLAEFRNVVADGGGELFGRGAHRRNALTQ